MNRLLPALLAALFNGAIVPVSKLLLADVGPVMLAGFLYLGCGIGVGALSVAWRMMSRGRVSEAPMKLRDAPWLAGAILAGGVWAPIVMFWGLGTTGAASASLLLNFEVVGTTLIAAIAFREAVGPRVWAAVALVTAGGMVLSFSFGDVSWGVSFGALLIVASCFLWGVDNNMSRAISSKDPLMITTVKGLAAGGMTVCVALAIGEGLPGFGACLAMMAAGFICYGLSLVFYIVSLRDLGAARTSAIFGAAPFVGALFSLAVFPGMPAMSFILALPLMMAGAMLLLTEAHAHEHGHCEVEHEHRHVHDEHHRHRHKGGRYTEGAHSHMHRHKRTVHSHPHVPDVHHRHLH